ncbi:hypothetical protein [Candidatus Methanoperedens nitratireducens]|uniref:Polymerase nucleotidyl transferase domain-containing protein n=1 Tax=Candidatus Methanoperedens nitratireducens TaxID=1392998 RepID=A0A284VJC7_9EURY|nr:hypothetical protein [Candidatus Methanoperedens nitroreducens]SNQ59360.1 conserved hypothetical protein [Candidatus Methanoperedens nitroreducens]
MALSSLMAMAGETIAGNKDNNLAGRILRTLHLADRRGYAMCLPHLVKNLVYGEVTEEAVRKELQTMPGISHSDGIYCLKGSEHTLAKTRKRLACNGKYVKMYEEVARRFASEYASICPFVRCIAVAGSMASEGFSEDDDIDFNIFVERGCKYTVYLLGILLSIKYSLRYRRKPLAACAATPFLPKLICINVIWEDEDVLPYKRQDEYLAYELLRQKPVLGLKFYLEVLSKNKWLGTYFPQIYRLDPSETGIKKTLAGRLLRLFYSNKAVSHLGERMCREISYLLWRFVQFSRRNNPEAIERVRWVTAMQMPYALFGDRV